MEPEEADYVTRKDVNIAILREIARIRLRERLPGIMAGVAERLVAAGVDFSQVRPPETLTITDDEWDVLYEDFYGKRNEADNLPYQRTGG